MTKTLLTELPKLIEVIDKHEHKDELIELLNSQVAEDTYIVKT
jgi:PII-like signaling protein